MKVLPEFEVLTLAHLLERHAGLQPESIALLAPGEQQISYAQLFAMAGNARHWLACRGLAPGARVAVRMPAGLELAVSCLVIACGAVCVPLHTGLAEPEVLTLLRDARADAVIGLQGDPVPARLARTLGLASLVFDMQEWLDAPPEDATDSSLYWPDPADTALVLMTSGTTGKSKRVPLRQQQLVHSAQQTALHLELRPDDRGLLVMPAYHSQGLVVGLLAPLAAGSTVVCAPVFDASEFLRWVSEFSPTWYTASPLVHQAVIDLVSYRRTGMPAHTFRMIRAASSPLPEILQRRMEDLWRVPVIQAYGITETAGQVTCNPLPPGVQKPGSVGHPV